MAFNKHPLKTKLALKASWIGACLVWTGHRDKRGYGRIRIGGKRMRAHRVAYELLIGPIPPGMLLMHSCDNPACIHVEHLKIGTQADNMADRDAKGRGKQLRGEAHPNAKLEEWEVALIRRRYVPRDRTSGARALAREFHVTHQVILAIVNDNARRGAK